MIINVKVKRIMDTGMSEISLNGIYAGMYPTDVANEIQRRITNQNTEEDE